MTAAERDELLIAYLEQKLSDEQLKTLEQLLSADPQAAERLAEIAYIDCALPEVMETENVELLCPDGLCGLEDPAERKVVRRSWTRVAWASAALLLFALLASLAWWSMTGGATPQTASATTLGMTCDSELTRVAANRSDAWSLGEAIASGKAQGWIELEHGNRVGLAPNSRVTLAGLNPPVVLLESGDAFFEISKQAPATDGVRFIVRTDKGEVKVTGTRFGVSRANGQTGVMVQEGRVEFRAGGESWPVEAGAACSVAQDGKLAPASPAELEWRFAELSQERAKAPQWLVLPGQGIPPQAGGDPLSAIRALLAAPGDALYAASGQAVVYRSLDGGSTWEPLSAGLTIPVRPDWYAEGPAVEEPVLSVLALGQKGDVLAASDSRLFEAHRGSVFRLPAGQRRWEMSAHSRPPNTQIRGLITLPSGETIVGIQYAGTEISTDGAKHFDHYQHYPEGHGSLMLLGYEPRSGAVFMGTETGFLRSTDKGQTWQLLDPLFSQPEGTHRATAFGYTRMGEVLAGISLERSENERTLFRLSPEGHWVKSNRGLPQKDTTRPHEGTEIDGEWPGVNAILEIVTAPSGEIFCIVKGYGIYRSRDEGHSWTAFNEGLPDTRVHSLAIDRRGFLYAGLASGVICRVRVDAARPALEPQP